MKKLTAEQIKRLKDVYFGVADEDELAEFVAHEDSKRHNQKFLNVLETISTQNQDLSARFLELVASFEKNTHDLSSKTGKSIEAMGRDLADRLLQKLDETKSTPPKDTSPLLLDIKNTLSDLKEVLTLYAMVTASQMKNLKRLAEGWYGGGQSFEFVRLDGTVDNSNTIFTIPSTKSIPRSDAIVLVWKDGAFTQSEEGDWTRTDGTFTFTFAPASRPASLYEK